MGNLQSCDRLCLKGDGNPDDYYALYERSLKTMNFDTSFVWIGCKMRTLWAFEYLRMDCDGSGHIVGLVTSLSLIKYA